MTATNDVKNTAAPDELEKPSIGESSPVSFKLGLIVGVVLLYVGTSSWWAAVISTKLDLVVASQRSFNGDIAMLKQRMDTFEGRLVKVEIGGSPTAQETLKQVGILQRMLDMHMAEDRKGKP